MAEPRPYYRPWPNRRLDAAGGPPDPAGRGRTIIPGLVDGRTRDLGAFANDVLIRRDRTPVYDNDTYRPAGSLVDWTMSGPIRRSLWMRNHTIRRMAGSDATRNLDPRPVTTYGTQDRGHGMHSNPVNGRAQSFRRMTLPANARMTAGRPNRLADSRYFGQSYSQTTRGQ